MKFASTLTGLLQRGGGAPIRRARPPIAWDATARRRASSTCC